MKTIVSIPSKKDFPAYISIPSEKKRYPGLIIIHEIWGLNDNIKNVSDRFSQEGYTVLVPDLLAGTEVEGKFTPQVIQEMRQTKDREAAAKIMGPILEKINSLEFKNITVEKLKACFNYLKNQGIEKIAVLGFCFGGTYSFALATEESDLSACLPFYGHAPEFDKIQNIKCPILAFYGEKDTQITSKLPQLKETLKKLGKNFQSVVYPGVGHAFFNDTNPATYNKEAAQDSWEKALGFLNKYLN